jgi:hypothetical protein
LPGVDVGSRVTLTPVKAALILGLLLNIVGTVLAGRALVDDWREHAEGRPLIPWLLPVRKWLLTVVRHNRLHQVTSTRSTSWNVNITGEGRVNRLIPEAGAPINAQIDYLRREVERLYLQMEVNRQEGTTSIDRVTAALMAAQNEAATATTNVERLARKIATGTVRMEMLGLLLIGLGSVVSVLPAVFGWR